jgi:tRNA(fMet)-specific endonuclease VapC
MYIFDTDHLSLIQRNGQEGKQILKRLAAIREVEVAVTVITYEEQVRGRLDVLSRAKRPDEQVTAYQNLQQLVIDYRSIIIIPFSDVAALENQRLRKAYPHIKSKALQILENLEGLTIICLLHSQSSALTDELERFNNVPFFPVIKAIETNTAFKPSIHFLHIVLYPLQRIQHTSED